MISEYFLSLPVAHWAGGLLFTYIAALLLHRLYLSPLARFPGSKLAAASFWYEFYYDVIKRGKYTWEIGRMHQQFGLYSLSKAASSLLTQSHRPNHTHQPIRAAYR